MFESPVVLSTLALNVLEFGIDWLYRLVFESPVVLSTLALNVLEFGIDWCLNLL